MLHRVNPDVPNPVSLRVPRGSIPSFSESMGGHPQPLRRLLTHAKLSALSPVHTPPFLSRPITPKIPLTHLQTLRKFFPAVWRGISRISLSWKYRQKRNRSASRETRSCFQIGMSAPREGRTLPDPLQVEESTISPSAGQKPAKMRQKAPRQKQLSLTESNRYFQFNLN